MSKYTNGWAWHDDATEEQMNSATNEGACNRLSREIANLYTLIPDRQDERYQDNLDHGYEIAFENGGREATEKWLTEQRNRTQKVWGEIEVLEEMLNARGARLKDDYEDWNEDAARMRYEDSRYEADERDY